MELCTESNTLRATPADVPLQYGGVTRWMYPLYVYVNVRLVTCETCQRLNVMFPTTVRAKVVSGSTLLRKQNVG
ncbi:unnamed protein product [Allacma fusca]|uniref:Uncharacterized protein n=1 Tax=Allacma fusca TaxID=39272 RepID=A0A8J2NMA3_9HEXA|nr:unnamed protein product [Allacma fusca]